VFPAGEANVVSTIDEYAAKHSLPGRGAVVREALAGEDGVHSIQFRVARRTRIDSYVPGKKSDNC